MRRLSIVRRNPFVLPMAVAAGLAIFFISEGSYWQSQDTINDLRENASIRQALETFEQALADAQRGQRGYLLTGQDAYLDPYRDGRTAAAQALSDLKRLFVDNAAGNARLAELNLLAKDQLDGIEETIRLMRTGAQPAALALVLHGAEKQRMDRVRVVTGQLMQEQIALRQQANQVLDRTLLLARYGVAALSAVLMAALLLYLRKSDDLAQAQAAQRTALQAAHDRLEAEVLQRTTQLTDLNRHLLTAREDERHRLARNLHDDLGSLLTAAKLDAARIRSRLGSDAPEAQARLADLVDKLNSSIALGRSIIEDLRPSTLDHLGLVATLDLLAAEFSQRVGIPVHARLEPVRLKPSSELVVYRVVQEALTNLVKYARAGQVWIALAPSATQPDQVELSIRDDGVGFDSRQQSRSAFGLLGMRFRVEAEGGSLRVQSGPGKGTQLEVSLPALVSVD